MHLFSATAVAAAVAILAFGPDGNASTQRITIPFKAVAETDISNAINETKSPSLEDIADNVISGAIIRDESDPDAAEGADLPMMDEDGRLVVEATEVLPPMSWSSFKVNYGTSLSRLFTKAGLGNKELTSVLGGEGLAGDISKLYPGQTLKFGRDDAGELLALELTYSPTESLMIKKLGDKFHGELEVKEPEVRLAVSSGIINGSLYLAAKKAGMSDKLTMNLADIFAWDLDFAYDIHKGDSFEVLYEELVIDGKKVGTGDILAASFVNKGKELKAIRHTGSDGRSAYYSPEGKSLERAFLRQPINARVSSSFNLQRRHPVLNIVRPHEGTDYAAPPGTPIMSAGVGKVEFSGWKGGYGRTVVIRHGDGITTLYAHMSRIDSKMKKGARVEQGQIVGTVGSSGMVTGPHLHYEFRVNGEPRDSRTVKLPDAKPIPESELASFKRRAASLEQTVADLTRKEKGPTMLSSAQ